MTTTIDTVYTFDIQTSSIGNTLKTEVVNLRLTKEQKASIDYAAAQAGISRTDFMVLAAVERAMDARYDQVRFVLPREDFDYLKEQVRSGRSKSQDDAIDRMNQVKLPWEK
jgi:uncharacterized protein (DUF1778 family)